MRRSPVSIVDYDFSVTDLVLCEFEVRQQYNNLFVHNVCAHFNERTKKCPNDYSAFCPCSYASDTARRGGAILVSCDIVTLNKAISTLSSRVYDLEKV